MSFNKSLIQTSCLISHYSSGCGYPTHISCGLITAVPNRLTSNCQHLHPCWREGVLSVAAGVCSAHTWLAGTAGELPTLPTCPMPSGCSSQPLTVGEFVYKYPRSSPPWVEQLRNGLQLCTEITCLIMFPSLAASLLCLISPLPHCAAWSQIKYLHLNLYLGHASEEPQL